MATSVGYTPVSPVSTPQNVISRFDCCKGFDDTYSIHLTQFISRDSFGTTIAQLNESYRQLWCCRGGIVKILGALIVLALVGSIIGGIVLKGKAYHDWKAWKKENNVTASWRDRYDAGYTNKDGCRGAILIAVGVAGLILTAVVKAICWRRKLRKFDNQVREQLAALNKGYVPAGIQWRYHVIRTGCCSQTRFVEIEVSSFAQRIL